MSDIGATQHILTNWLFKDIRERRVCMFFFMLILLFCCSFIKMLPGHIFKTRPQTVQQAYITTFYYVVVVTPPIVV